MNSHPFSYREVITKMYDKQIFNMCSNNGFIDKTRNNFNLD